MTIKRVRSVLPDGQRKPSRKAAASESCIGQPWKFRDARVYGVPVPADTMLALYRFIRYRNRRTTSPLEIALWLARNAPPEACALPPDRFVGWCMHAGDWMVRLMTAEIIPTKDRYGVPRQVVRMGMPRPLIKCVHRAAYSAVSYPDGWPHIDDDGAHHDPDWREKGATMGRLRRPKPSVDPDYLGKTLWITRED